MTTALTVHVPLRPWNTNAERSGNRWDRADRVRTWRTLTAAAAWNTPVFDTFTVTVQPHQRGGKLADVAACNPAVKAMIDGLIDAGLAPDDSPRHLRGITFLPPTRGQDGVTLYVDGDTVRGTPGRIAVT